jgi:uncharacterized protein (TIGR02145 family)
VFLLASCKEKAELLADSHPFVFSPSVSDINADGVTLKAKVIESSDAIVEYGFRFGLSESSTLHKNGLNLDVEVEGMEFSSKLEGPALKGNQFYYFRPVVRTESGFFVFGPMSSFQYDGPGYQMTDIDGNQYPAVQLGNLIWMAENLKVSHYSNGDPIITDLSYFQWSNTNQGAYSVYPSYFIMYPWFYHGEGVLDKLGGLYNWYAVVDERGLCPTGWRVPTDDDWKYLEGYADSGFGIGDPVWDLSGPEGRGKDIGSKLMIRKRSWIQEFSGSDDFGFSGLPAGYLKQYGNFEGEWEKGRFWSATERDETTAWWRGLRVDGRNIVRDAWHKTVGFSVRCVRDVE